MPLVWDLSNRCRLAGLSSGGAKTYPSRNVVCGASVEAPMNIPGPGGRPLLGGAWGAGEEASIIL